MGHAVASPVVGRHNGSSAGNATAVGPINGNLGHQRNQVTHELGCAEQELREMQLEKVGMVAELERLDTGSPSLPLSSDISCKVSYLPVYPSVCPSAYGCVTKYPAMRTYKM